jgi:hypothetical protein
MGLSRETFETMLADAIVERVATRFPYSVEDVLERLELVISSFGCVDSGFLGESLQDPLGVSAYEYCMACTRGDASAREWQRRLLRKLRDGKEALKKGVVPKRGRPAKCASPVHRPPSPKLKLSPNAMRRFKVVRRFCSREEMNLYARSFKKLAY